MRITTYEDVLCNTGIKREERDTWVRDDSVVMVTMPGGDEGLVYVDGLRNPLRVSASTATEIGAKVLGL